MSSKGESIIEIVIVAFFLASMFTALVSLVIVSVARNRLAKERTVATRLSQQGLEWLRNQRDELGYGTFSTEVLDGQYCLPSNLTSFSISNNRCSGGVCNASNCTSITASGVDYFRYAVLTISGTTITTEMRVTWGSDSNQTITQTGVLDQWQR